MSQSSPTKDREDVSVDIDFSRAPRMSQCECSSEYSRVQLIEVTIPGERTEIRYHYGCGRCGHYWRERARLTSREPEREIQPAAGKGSITPEQADRAVRALSERESETEAVGGALRLAFDVDHPGDRLAGMYSYTDRVRVVVDSGNPGGHDPGEFEEYMRRAIAEWYDGATVTPLESAVDEPKDGSGFDWEAIAETEKAALAGDYVTADEFFGDAPPKESQPQPSSEDAICDIHGSGAATCVGSYDGERVEFGCDTCCGHSQEGGWCVSLSEPRAIKDLLTKLLHRAERAEPSPVQPSTEEPAGRRVGKLVRVENPGGRSFRLEIEWENTVNEGDVLYAHPSTGEDHG